MSSIGEIPGGREMGEILTVSVGTALALEALINKEKPVNYDYLYLNVRTLLRNYYGAHSDPENVDKQIFRNEFIAELEHIKGVVENAIAGNIQPVFYVCSLKSINKFFPFGKIKTPTTNNQKNYEALERFVIEHLMTTPFGKNIKLFDCLVDGKRSKSLILTHFPMELLSHNEFRVLDLIESHTGTIKDRSMWNSKLTNPENYRNLPFNILTIQVIGDHATQFNSLGIKFIKPLMEIAEKNNWSAATTHAKVKFDIEKFYDKFTANVFLEMLKVKLK